MKPFGEDINSATDVAVFRDEIIVPEFHPELAEVGSIAQIRNLTAVPIAILSRPWDDFPTEIDLTQASEDVWHQPEFGFPFDWVSIATLGIYNAHVCLSGLETLSSQQAHGPMPRRIKTSPEAQHRSQHSGIPRI